MKLSISEHRLEIFIGNLLRAGVLSATAVVLAGGLWYLISAGHQAFARTVFRGEPAQLRTLGGILSGFLNGDGRGLIQLGLLILLATPIARVVLSLGAFGVQRDRMYVIITAIVLLTLGYSLTGG